MGRPRRTFPPKHCLQCGNQLQRRPTEGTTWYAKRKYCSIPCRQAAHVKNKDYAYTVEELEFLTQPGFPQLSLHEAATRLKWTTPRMLEETLEANGRFDLLSRLKTDTVRGVL